MSSPSAMNVRISIDTEDNAKVLDLRSYKLDGIAKINASRADPEMGRKGLKERK